MRRADVAVYSPDGNLQLVVEIKNRPSASAEWVTHMRRNLLVHAVIPPSPYFLLVLPDFFYLWKDAMSVHELAPPAYQMKAAEVLAPYLDLSTQSLTDLSEYSLELLVTSWLEDLVGTELRRDTVGPHLQWLFDSGLYEAIRHGSVMVEATA
jgi:hypothetical protein